MKPPLLRHQSPKRDGAHCDRSGQGRFLVRFPGNLLSDYRHAGVATAAGAECERSPQERGQDDFSRALFLKSEDTPTLNLRGK